MYYEDHNPPHFHASYGEYKVIVEIENGLIVKGDFPMKQQKLVLAWCEIHRQELLDNWLMSKEYGKLTRIDPLR